MKRTRSKTGFPPVNGKGPVALILGTMPGEESLRKKRYYANPRNQFWSIIVRLFGKRAEPPDYQRLKRLLTGNRIALWDVIRSCERKGSLDSAIVGGSVEANDFASFYGRFPSIRHVFFNGGGAEKEYRRRVLAALPGRFGGIRYHRLPSTSPAMAALTAEEKFEAWAAVGRCVKRPQRARVRRLSFSRIRDRVPACSRGKNRE